MENLVQPDVIALNRIDAVKMILKTLSNITALRYSIVARVTEDSWTACAIYDDMNFGLNPGDELALKTTYCNTIREQNAPLLVKHASREPEFKAHPALHTYAVESYIGVPLYRQSGEYFGVLCALDTNPTDISEKNIAIFTLMASLIAHELEAEDQRRALDEALKLAHQTNETRARFMGILGHDLRNPLSTITMGANLLKGGKLSADENARIADKLLRTSRRMNFMIEDLLDASQAAQGNRILINKKTDSLNNIYEPIIEEFRLANPGRQIDFFAQEAFYGEWDEGRLGQVLSNLLSNALSYGRFDSPVKVTLRREGTHINLEVNNQGEAMSEEVRSNLFTAFWRGARKGGTNANSSGLGLGLFIVKQIVEAHGGTISVESHDKTGTSFTVSFINGT